jgi:hypothetical protein
MANNLTEPPEHRRCTARARRSGSRCKRAAIAGGRVCPSHGGNAPQVRQRAAERVALAQIRTLLDVDEAADPRTVLLQAVKAAAAVLGAAQASVTAEDADAGDVAQLVSAAVVAGRLAKLALDAAALSDLHTVAAIDAQIAALESRIGVEDPEWLAGQREREAREGRVAAFQARWSPPGAPSDALRDPAAFMAESLDLAIGLLDVPGEQMEAITLEVERVLWQTSAGGGPR